MSIFKDLIEVPWRKMNNLTKKEEKFIFITATQYEHLVGTIPWSITVMIRHNGHTYTTEEYENLKLKIFGELG